MSRNIVLLLAYDGTNYHGWQYQIGKRTIQGELQRAIAIVTGQRVSLIGAGRTDAGVHAKGQVANFLINSTIPIEAIKKALNSTLPKDIRVLEAREEKPEFNARYHAKAKVYEYRILNRSEGDVFLVNYAWHIPTPLDLELMGECLSHLVGRNDFSSFASSGGAAKTFVREMYEARLEKENDLIRLYFKANGFLRHMVRNIVGTLVQFCFKRKGPSQFQELLELKDRKRAGPKAPAQGLYLLEVIY